MEVYCNDERCKHNDKQRCTASKLGIVDQTCVTFRHRPRQENYRELMRAPFNPNCDKDSGGGYKSNRVKGVIK